MGAEATGLRDSKSFCKRCGGATTYHWRLPFPNILGRENQTRSCVMFKGSDEVEASGIYLSMNCTAVSILGQGLQGSLSLFAQSSGSFGFLNGVWCLLQLL
jgi:hypothetical protein